MEAGSPHGSVAASASQRVQAILEAAEASAAEIRREAEAEAQLIREQARADAGRASESIEATLARLEDLHGQLGALIASLRGHPSPASTEPGERSSVAAGDPTDVDSARLVALDMALAGTPREQTARHLADQFALTDSDALLDEVYASAGG